MLNRETFFAYARNAPFGGSLTSAQKAGTNLILDYCEALKLPLVWIAYILATAFHESAHTMQPVRETLATSDKQAIARLDAAFKAGKLKSVKTPYWRPDSEGKSWFGRGLVQITHKVNYLKFKLSDPSAALKPDVAVKVLVDGMRLGLFSTRRLKDYGSTEASFNAVGARAIVNGTDRASLIAGYYEALLPALKAAAGQQSVNLSDEKMSALATPDDQDLTNSPVAQTVLSTLGGGGIMSAVFGISNPWGFAVVALILIITAVFGWGYFTGRIHFKRAA